MDINGNSRDNEAASKRDLRSRQIRSVYLITYSQADTEMVSSRNSFAVIVLDSFQNADPQSQSQVVQWVCSEESHKEGGIHYHMAVKLDRNRRWLCGHEAWSEIKFFKCACQLLFCMEICYERRRKVPTISRSSGSPKCTAENARG